MFFLFFLCSVQNKIQPPNGKQTNKHVLCATEGTLMFRDMVGHMLLDGQLGTTNRRHNSTGTGSQDPSCSALLEVWPQVQSDRFINANSHRVASPLIIVGETENKLKRPTTRFHQRYCASYKGTSAASHSQRVHVHAHRSIHVAVSSTLRLIDRTNHQHFHKENRMELIYCSVRPPGYTFICRTKWSALHEGIRGMVKIN